MNNCTPAHTKQSIPANPQSPQLAHDRRLLQHSLQTRGFRASHTQVTAPHPNACNKGLLPALRGHGTRTAGKCPCKHGANGSNTSGTPRGRALGQLNTTQPTSPAGWRATGRPINRPAGLAGSRKSNQPGRRSANAVQLQNALSPMQSVLQNSTR